MSTENTTQPPHQDRGEVDSLRALAELLAMPSGYEVVEHLPGIWHFTYPGDDGELMASSASWNHPAIAATEAWLNAALTEAKQQGPGEAESPSLKQTPAWWVGYPIGPTGRAPYHCIGPDMPASRYANESVHWIPLYTAPQVEAKRKTGEGFVLVPIEPSDDMVARGRTAVMALECSGPKWTVRQHYRASGEDTTGIPDQLLDAGCPMPKADRADLIYRAMIAAAAKPSGE